MKRTSKVFCGRAETIIVFGLLALGFLPSTSFAGINHGFSNTLEINSPANVYTEHFEFPDGGKYIVTVSKESDSSPSKKGKPTKIILNDCGFVTGDDCIETKYIWKKNKFVQIK